MSGLEIIGLAASVGGSIASGVTAVAQAAQKAQVAKYNRLMAERNERITLAQTDADVFDKQQQNIRQLGTIRATYGASGLAMGGSMLDVLADTATEQAYDVEKTRYKGKVRAMGYADKAGQFAMEEDFAPVEGALGVVSSIFKVGSSVAGSPTVSNYLTRTG